MANTNVIDRPTLTIGIIERTDDGVNTDEPYKVIVYNDETHTFDEVIDQLIKAIKCTRTYASDKDYEIDRVGKAVVYVGQPAKCFEVSDVLDEIKLHVTVEV